MFETLDGVEWDALEDAYGKASDIPDLLRSLATSQDEESLEETLEDLESRVCNQGCINEASPYVVPFLIELLSTPEVEAKEEILGLLTGLGTAKSYLDVHIRNEPGPVAEKWRAEPDFEEKVAREQAWVEATRHAIEAGLPTFFALLEGNEDGLRYPAANLLGALKTSPERVSAGLREAFARETSDGVRCGLLMSLGEVGREEDVPFLREILADASGSGSAKSKGSRPLRWGSAIALVRILKADAPAEAVRVLDEASLGGSEPELDEDAWEGLPDGERESARGAIFTLFMMGPDAAVPRIGRALGRLDVEDLGDALELLLDLAFPGHDRTTEPTPPREPGSLTPAQKEALAAFVACDDLWDPGWRLDGTLRWLGLPDERGKIEAFIA
ncbi:hypothetical protein [Singulisphaera sp. PoT]|uniref:hypothetical protein n=1 Tax=Singulisphaera sp. PoT TaxID=3411797 RepID=UPI003BF4B8F7